MLKIAIVGAGFSGCYLYNRLEKLGHKITIFEKSRGTGGRLSTKYVENKFCDHGTYSFKTKNPDFISFCNEQVSKGILKKSNNYYLPTSGMNSLCKSLINKNDLKTNTKIISCLKNTNKWTLKDENQNVYKDFDLLILTIPATQILMLDLTLEDDIKSKLENVKYDSIISFILYSNHKFNLNEKLQNLSFFKEIINNSKKYNYKNFSSYVIYVNEEFSSSNNNKSKEFLGELVYKYLQYYQEDILSENIHTIPHLWKYAFVKKGINSMNYYYYKNNNLAICSDYFQTKNLEGSFISSKAFTDELF